MCLARQGLGKTYRLLAEFKLKDKSTSFSMDNNEAEIEYCIFGVGNLGFSFYLSQNTNWFTKEETDSMVVDMDEISNMFFLHIVPTLHNKNKLTRISLFQQAFGNIADISEVSWKNATFKCVNRQFQILVN